MGEGPAPHGDTTQDKARAMVMALTGFLSLAAAANVTAYQRVQFATAASRQARLLRGLVHGPFLLVLAREHATHAEGLKRAFGGGAGVEVIVDRRAAEAPLAAQAVERRDPKEQRVEEDLRRIGGAAVVRPREAAEARLPSGPPADGAKRPRRVLLIDDDAAIIQMLSSYFSDGDPGYAVEAALNGEKGLAKLQAHRPDVVLLDISMPGMNGLEVLARIRQLDPSIPVIMVTGANYRDTSQALTNGAFAYLPKPFDFRYVDHLVTLAIEQRPASRPAS
jgi:CheY-like chemotaxis protein